MATDAWLAARRRWVLGLLVAASLVVRLLYVVQLASGPCLAQHRWDESDMHFFDAWARRIADGDWVGATPHHPRHGWYADLALHYFARHPEARQRFVAEGAGDPTWAFWDRWYGGPRFHQEPLYPYLVALTYRLLGPDVGWVFAWQLGLGVATNLLVWAIARRHFGERVGLVAGLLAVVCAPRLMYELVLLRTTAVAFAGVGLLVLAEGTLARPSVRRWLATGVAFGLALTLQATLVLLLPGVVAVRVAQGRWTSGRLARELGALSLGLGLALAPVVARNLAVGVPALALSSVGPTVFLLSNVRGYRPDLGFSPAYDQLARVMGESDGSFRSVVRATVKTHDGPIDLLRLLGAKLAVLWHWYELPNNTNFYYYGLHAPVLRALPLTFTLLAPLALVGFALAAPAVRRHVLLYWLAATMAAPMLVFYVLSRFRAALAPALIPFAALALVRLAAWIRHGPRRAAAFALAALLGLALWTGRPLADSRPLIRRADYEVPYLAYWEPEVEHALGRDEPRRAAMLLAESLRIQPDVVGRLGATNPAHDDEEAAYATFYASVYDRWARALAAAGEQSSAAAAAARASELARAARIGG